MNRARIRHIYTYADAYLLDGQERRFFSVSVRRGELGTDSLPRFYDRISFSSFVRALRAQVLLAAQC